MGEFFCSSLRPEKNELNTKDNVSVYNIIQEVTERSQIFRRNTGMLVNKPNFYMKLSVLEWCSADKYWRLKRKMECMLSVHSVINMVYSVLCTRRCHLRNVSEWHISEDICGGAIFIQFWSPACITFRGEASFWHALSSYEVVHIACQSHTLFVCTIFRDINKHTTRLTSLRLTL